MRRNLGVGVLLLGFLGCSDVLDGVGNVHDLRLLAIRAEPPEQLVTYDGGIVVTALFANPPGGYLVGGKWTTCPELDSATSRCPEGSADTVLLGETTSETTLEGGQASVTFGVNPLLLSKIVKADPYRGFAGIRQVIQVELRAGDERIYGIKRVVFHVPTPKPRKLNVNPVVGDVRFNDGGWEPGVPVQFKVVAPSTPSQQFNPPAVRNELRIVEDEALFETYDVTTFEGETRTLKETFRYNFFTNNGTFSPTQAGGANLLNPNAGSIVTTWAPVDSEDNGSGPTAVWIVVRDGRGGESWTVRRAEAP